MMVQIGVSYKNLRYGVEGIVDIFEHVPDSHEENKICLIFLPISILAVAAVLDRF